MYFVHTRPDGDLLFRRAAAARRCTGRTPAPRCAAGSSRTGRRSTQRTPRSRKAPGGGGMDQQRAEDGSGLGRVHRHAAALCQRLHPTISLIGQIELADNSVHGLAEKSNRRFTPSCGAATGAQITPERAVSAPPAARDSQKRPLPGCHSAPPSTVAQAIRGRPPSSRRRDTCRRACRRPLDRGSPRPPAMPPPAAAERRTATGSPPGPGRRPATRGIRSARASSPPCSRRPRKKGMVWATPVPQRFTASAGGRETAVPPPP